MCSDGCVGRLLQGNSSTDVVVVVVGEEDLVDNKASILEVVQ